jgi:hypothetical protein
MTSIVNEPKKSPLKVTKRGKIEFVSSVQHDDHLSTSPPRQLVEVVVDWILELHALF